MSACEVYGTVLVIIVIRRMGREYQKSCDVWDGTAKKELSCKYLAFECLPRHLLAGGKKAYLLLSKPRN